jgi:hypothetical protein
MTYAATEFDRRTMKPTGHVEYYAADDIDAAVAKVLYTRRLSNGAAFIGPSGRCVYSSGLCYSVTLAV